MSFRVDQYKPFQLFTENGGFSGESEETTLPPPPKSSSPWVFPVSLSLGLFGVGAVILWKVQPLMHLRNLTTGLERDILAFLTRKDPPARLTGAPLQQLRDNLNDLLRALASKEDGLPLFRKVEHLSGSPLPTYLLEGRIAAAGGGGSRNLKLTIHALENPFTDPSKPHRVRSTVIRVSINPTTGIVALDSRSVKLGEVCDDQLIKVRLHQSGQETTLPPLGDEIALERSSLGLPIGKELTDFYPQDGFRIVGLQPERIRGWSDLLRDDRWTGNLRFCGRLPKPIYRREHLGEYAGLYEDITAQAEKGTSVFFRVGSVTPPGAGEDKATVFGTIYRFTRGGRLAKIELVERGFGASPNPLLDIEYAGTTTVVEFLAPGTVHAQPKIDMGRVAEGILQRLKMLVWGEKPPAQFSADDWQLYRSIDQALQNNLFPRLAREETTLPRGVSFLYSTNKGKKTSRALLNIQGNYHQKDGVWHLYFTMEQLAEEGAQGQLRRQYRTVRFPIDRRNGSLDFGDKIHTYPPELVDDSIGLVHFYPSGSDRPVVQGFRQSFLGRGDVDLATLFETDQPGKVFAIQAFDPYTFYAWGREIDSSRLTHALVTHGERDGGRVPVVIHNMDVFLGRPSFPKEIPGVRREGNRQIFPIAEITREVPWATGSEGVLLEVVHQRDAAGRYLSHQLVERCGASTYVGFEVRAFEVGRGQGLLPSSWTGRSAGHPYR
ncbi:MAG: hypothetical protein HYT76_05415 [Deltaproteobacteria bacterium]|nr:hypothetical protein [Deltaproteobacteria bacterium]